MLDTGTTTAGEITRTPGSLARTCGRGVARGHFGEMLQGTFRTADGAICRGLVTLRCALFGSIAYYEPDGTLDVAVTPAHCGKARQAAENTLAYLGVVRGGGRLALRGNTPTGIGAGSSTTDVVATVWAVGNAFGAGLTEMEVARIAVDTEVAVDPIMLCSSPEVLFAHRRGTVLERFVASLPPLHVIGVTDGPPVDTVALPPARYARAQVDEFEILRGRLRAAVAARDPGALGEVATRSAQINQAYLPKPSFPTLLDIMRDSRAVGLSVSHSGSAAGLLFDARPRADNRGVALAHRLLAEAGFDRRWTFQSGSAS